MENGVCTRASIFREEARRVVRICEKPSLLLDLEAELVVCAQMGLQSLQAHLPICEVWFRGDCGGDAHHEWLHTFNPKRL